MDLKPWLDSMTCTVLLHDDFADEMVAFDEKLQDEVQLALVKQVNGFAVLGVRVAKQRHGLER